MDTRTIASAARIHGFTFQQLCDMPTVEQLHFTNVKLRTDNLTIGVVRTGEGYKGYGGGEACVVVDERLPSGVLRQTYYEQPVGYRTPAVS